MAGKKGWKYEKCDLNDPEQEAICEKIGNWTRDLRDLDAQGCNGTGIAMRIGSKCFLATVAHLIRTGHRFEPVRRTTEPRVSSDFPGVHWTDGDDDVGVLELSDQQAEVIGSFVDGKDIVPAWDDEREWDVYVTGFPACTHFRAAPSLQASLCTHLSSMTIAASKWPDNLDRDLVRGRDLLMKYYGQTVYRIKRRGTSDSTSGGRLQESPAPHGMSGGGIWLLAMEESPGSKIVLPAPKLIGVQTGYYRDSELLRGVRIVRWLDLVEKYYPDLGANISAIRQNQFREQ